MLFFYLKSFFRTKVFFFVYFIIKVTVIIAFFWFFIFIIKFSFVIPNKSFYFPLIFTFSISIELLFLIIIFFVVNTINTFCVSDGFIQILFLVKCFILTLFLIIMEFCLLWFLLGLVFICEAVIFSYDSSILWILFWLFSIRSFCNSTMHYITLIMFWW